MTPPISTQRSPDPAVSLDERLLAGAAHLAFLGGFWLVAPLAILVLMRKQSRYVAFHAMQATLLAIAMVPIAIGAWMLAILAQIAGVVFLGEEGASYLFVGLFLLTSIGPALAVAMVGIVAGIRALRGKTWSVPFVGRIARNALAAP